MALPVLVLLFVAIFFYRDLSGARHAAATQARSCAWLYSANNCREVPPGCEGVLTNTTAIGDVSDASLPIPSIGEGKEENRNVNRIVGGLLESAIVTLFGSGAKAHASREVKRPALLGGGTLTTSNDYHLACNLAPTTPGQVVKDAWDIWSPL